MSSGGDFVRIGRLRLSRRKFKRRVYQLISLFIAFLMVATLLYTILFGASPQ